MNTRKEIDERCRQTLMEMLEIDDPALLQSLIDGILNGTYQYMLTVDAGCGNTSAAVSSFATPKIKDLVHWTYKFINEYHRQVTLKDTLSIPTILGYDDDGIPVLGPEAFDYGEVAENFKRTPTSQNLKARFAKIGEAENVSLTKIWIDYFKMVIVQAFTYAKNHFNGFYDGLSWNNVLIVVARPASEEWKDNISNYRDLIYKGLADQGIKRCQIITFSEAKAAMQYVRTEKELNFDWNKGVLVIDLGASTIDAEFLGLQQNKSNHQDSQKNTAPEYSIEVAGRDVDYLLGHRTLASLYPDELHKLPVNELPDNEFFYNHRDVLVTSKSDFSFTLRTNKEQLCSSNLHRQPPYETVEMHCGHGHAHENWNVEMLTHLLSQTQFSASYSDPDLRTYAAAGNTCMQITNSWYGHLTTLVGFMFSQLQGRIPDKVIVTGGTANLLGIEDAIRNGFGKAGLPRQSYPDLVVLNDSLDYERTVPFGAASYMHTVIQNIQTILNAPNDILPKAKQDFMAFAPDIVANHLYPVVYNKVLDELNKWVALPKGNQKASINGLMNAVASINFNCREYNDAIRAAKQEIEDYASQENLPETMKEIREILKKCSGKAEYNHSINLRNVRLNLDTQIIGKAVKEGLPDIWQCMNVSTYLRNFFRGDDDPLPQGSRKKIPGNFKAKNTIKDSLSKSIRNKFAGGFDQSSGFGICDFITVNLMTDIRQAMFLGTPKEEDANEAAAS